MKIKSRKVYFLRYRDGNGNMQEIQFPTKYAADMWVNQAINDAGRYADNKVLVSVDTKPAAYKVS